MVLPQQYKDETSGVRPGPNEKSFNNIVYTVWYMIARKLSGKLNNFDIDSLMRHINLNEDENGLYKPKNSHDNITYKMIASLVFYLNNIEKMEYFAAIKNVGILKPWDWITYGAVFGPVVLRPFFILLLFIPAIQMIAACSSGDKKRPNWVSFNDKKLDWQDSRLSWWFKRTELVHREETDTAIYEHWKISNGDIKVLKRMQNDGKHIALFRLYALKDKFKVFGLCAKICRRILIKTYGTDYTYEIINKYFEDRKHPVIPMWKGHGDILK